MHIKNTIFLKSSPDYKQCPEPTMPEYAFIGRSNVGKSSLINMLLSRKNLAKTSQKPGKTQLINHFLVNEAWYLVDLPGYGWAKVSKSEREKWDKMIQEYLMYRPNLQCIFALIDARLEPQQIDLEFMEWLGKIGIAFVRIFTKGDKQSNHKNNVIMQAHDQKMLENWEEVPKKFLSSAVNNAGKEEILTFIEDLNQSFYKNIQKTKKI